MDDAFLDREAWQRMLEREGVRPSAPGIAVGLLRRDDYRGRCGTLLVWEQGACGLRAAYRPYQGVAPDDLGLLLVADDPALDSLREQGFASMAPLIRRRRLDPYILKTMDQLEAGGLADFVEDLALNPPHH